MNCWPLYRRIESALTPEFEVVEASADGVLVIDDDGYQWLVTAKQGPVTVRDCPEVLA